jgi:hypothetical protein
MKFVKAGLFFAVAFLLAWVTIFTFIQGPFHEPVSAIILWYRTAPYPIYYYLLASLSAGLLIGIGMTLYYYVTFSSAVRARSRELDDMAEQNAQLRKELKRAQLECEDLRERSTLRKTERMPALPQRPAHPGTPGIPGAPSVPAATATPGTPGGPSSPPAPGPRPAGPPSPPAPAPRPASPPKNVDRLWK